MLTFNYGSPYFWDKVVLTKFISGCRMVWDLICGTSWFYKSKTEKVTGGGMSAILPNWCCLLSITVLFTHPCYKVKKNHYDIMRYIFFCEQHSEGCLKRFWKCIFCFLTSLGSSSKCWASSKGLQVQRWPRPQRCWLHQC